MMFWRAGLPGLLRLLVIAGMIFSGGWETPRQASRSMTLYLPQPGTPTAIPNFVDPGAGCNWWGVGGQVFSKAGRPEAGLIVQISGVVDGMTVNQRVVSGSSLVFGAGGFNLQIATYLPTYAALKLQLFDAAGRPLSTGLVLPFFRSCNQNLMVVNVRQRTIDHVTTLPFMSR